MLFIFRILAIMIAIYFDMLLALIVIATSVLFVRGWV